MTRRADLADVWHLREDRGAVLSVVDGPAGSLLVSGYAARAGILVYRDAAGRETRELVPESTLLDSAGTLGRAVVTLQHPSEDVTPSNVDRLGVGDVDSQIDMAGGYVQVRVAVRRKDAIEAVRSGTVELSPGYRVQLDATPGVDPVYGRYDAVQVRREVNHLAIVDRARGGPTIRLRTDAAEATDTIERPALPHTTEAPVHQRWLPIFLALGITQRYDSDDQAAEAVRQSLQGRTDSAATATTTLTAERDRERARADSAEARVKALEAAEATRADAAERAELEPVATHLGLDPKAIPDLKGLRRAVAAKQLGAEIRADETDDYVRALVDQAKTAHKGRRTVDPASRVNPWEPPPRHDGDPDPQRVDGPDLRNLSENDRWLARVKAARAQA